MVSDVPVPIPVFPFDLSRDGFIMCRGPPPQDVSLVSFVVKWFSKESMAMDLETCPFCVEPIPHGSHRCPHCGQPIRSSSTADDAGDPPRVDPLAGQRRPPVAGLDGGDAAIFSYFEGEDLRGAMLSEANLRGADLSEADLCGADLQGADLTGADLTGARYDSLTLWPEGLDPAAAGAVRVSHSR
jgi:hypothetical protein